MSTRFWCHNVQCLHVFGYQDVKCLHVFGQQADTYVHSLHKCKNAYVARTCEFLFSVEPEHTYVLYAYLHAHAMGTKP